MREVMYPWDLLAILRKADGDFHIFWSNVNGYREAGVYWRDKHICHAEANYMPREDVEEPDPWIPGRVYYRSGWKRILSKLVNSDKLPESVRERLKTAAKRMDFACE